MTKCKIYTNNNVKPLLTLLITMLLIPKSDSLINGGEKSTNNRVKHLAERILNKLPWLQYRLKMC